MHIQGNDLRLRLSGGEGGGGGGNFLQSKAAKNTFQAHQPEEEEFTGDRWSNDMYFKSGQSAMAAPLRQAVTERAPSFLTTAGGKRREATAAVSKASSRALASAGILSVSQKE